MAPFSKSLPVVHRVLQEKHPEKKSSLPYLCGTSLETLTFWAGRKHTIWCPDGVQMILFFGECNPVRFGHEPRVNSPTFMQPIWFGSYRWWWLRTDVQRYIQQQWWIQESLHLNPYNTIYPDGLAPHLQHLLHGVIWGYLKMKPNRGRVWPTSGFLSVTQHRPRQLLE